MKKLMALWARITAALSASYHQKPLRFMLCCCTVCYLLLACGIGNPCFSTDTCVVLRGIELECDAILMAKNIDGVYTADPHVDPSATLIPDISYAEAAERDLRVMDAAAFSLLKDNNVPNLRVFGLEPPTNILKVLDGDPMGTILHP